jgi:PEP-CTERM motif
MQRGLITAVMLAMLAGVCWQSAVRFFKASPWRASQPVSQSAWTRGNVHANLSSLATRTSLSAHSPAQKKRSVYPYAVVPGGVENLDDLRRATQHDYVVWQHYARFQYQHARLVRATEARQVYLSYRLRDRVFWTRKRVRLHLGELLLTDGNITARAKCGNQISETPKPDVSEEEPAEDVFDRPVAALEPRAPALPIRSSLLPPSLPGVSPLPPGGPQVFTGGGFVFPTIPFSVPIPGRLCKPADDNEKDEKPCPPQRHKPPVVPEPSTLVLIGSGLTAVYWRYRKTGRALSD